MIKLFKVTTLPYQMIVKQKNYNSNPNQNKNKGLSNEPTVILTAPMVSTAGL